jgi:hypothetical protein
MLQPQALQQQLLVQQALMSPQLPALAASMQQQQQQQQLLHGASGPLAAASPHLPLLLQQLTGAQQPHLFN